MTEELIEGKTLEEWKRIFQKWGDVLEVISDPIRLKIMIALQGKAILDKKRMEGRLKPRNDQGRRNRRKRERETA